jgi:hypothetical protein
MRTTVTLDDDVHETVLHLSRVSGESLGKVLSELARKALAPAVTRSNSKLRKRFPTFQVPPGTPIILATRVQELIDEEG